MLERLLLATVSLSWQVMLQAIESDRRRPGLSLVQLGHAAPLAAIIVALSFIDALSLSARLVQTSDSTQGFVAGDAVARGNLLLSGWHFPFNDYFFTDTLAYAGLEWLAGPSPLLLAFVPALIYAALVCVALFVSVRHSQPIGSNIESAATIALILAAPGWIGAWNPLLMSDMHLATVLFALIALGLLAGIARSGSPNAWMTATLGGALLLTSAVTVASDPFSLVFVFGPAAALLLADLIPGRPTMHRGLALLILAGGVTLGLLLPTLIAHVGGFTTENDVITGFVSVDRIPHNLAAIFFGVLTLFGANPTVSGPGFSGFTLLALHGIGLAIAIVAVARTARHLFTPDRPPLFDKFLCAGVATTLLACACSAQFGKGVTPQNIWAGGPPMRYLMPVFLFAAVLAGRQVSEILSSLVEAKSHPLSEGGWYLRANLHAIASGLVIVFAALAMLVSAQTIASHPISIVDNPATRVAAWLGDRGLKQGVGEYWSANLVTAMSGDSVRVRGVVPAEGKLVAYVWSSDANSYAQTPQFAVWQDGNPTDVTLEDVHATWSVCRTALVAGYRIAVLGKKCGGRNI